MFEKEVACFVRLSKRNFDWLPLDSRLRSERNDSIAEPDRFDLSLDYSLPCDIVDVNMRATVN